MRGVHRVAGDGVAVSWSDRSGQYLAGVDTNLEDEGRIDGRERLGEGERGANGALGIVLVGDRGAEHRHQLVPDDLVDVATMERDDRHHHPEATVEQFLHRLRVTMLRQCGEVGEIGKDHSDHTPFGLTDRGGDRAAAVGAEPGQCGNDGSARRAGVGAHGRWPGISRASPGATKTFIIGQSAPSRPPGQSARRVC